uniref:Uncharacterized protein n=1 Tax=Lactuca sativa TaxID=4236 RepID=A0A9R1UQV5_LACSA|nr:hypothetical protein LSAT_V11C800452290 [Lactuca sativa]
MNNKRVNDGNRRKFEFSHALVLQLSRPKNIHCQLKVSSCYVELRNIPRRGDYFYESPDKIEFLFKEKAFDDDGKLKQPKQRSINKCNHGMCNIQNILTNM